MSTYNDTDIVNGVTVSALIFVAIMLLVVII